MLGNKHRQTCISLLIHSCLFIDGNITSNWLFVMAHVVRPDSFILPIFIPFNGREVRSIKYEYSMPFWKQNEMNSPVKKRGLILRKC